MKKILKTIRKPFDYLRYEFNSILNRINYNRFIKKANRLYQKTKIHRHVVPLTKIRLGIITGSDLVTYNKKVLNLGLKKIRYNKLKKEAYYSTDNLNISKQKDNYKLSPIIKN